MRTTYRAHGFEPATLTMRWESADVTAVKCVVWDLDGTVWPGVAVESADDVLPRRSPTFWPAWTCCASAGSSAASHPARRRSCCRSCARIRTSAERIVWFEAGWGHKSESIVAIAQRLGIGTDAIALVDDSEFERGEVASVLPDVRVVDPATLADVIDGPDFVPDSRVDGVAVAHPALPRGHRAAAGRERRRPARRVPRLVRHRAVGRRPRPLGRRPGRRADSAHAPVQLGGLALVRLADRAGPGARRRPAVVGRDRAAARQLRRVRDGRSRAGRAHLRLDLDGRRARRVVPGRRPRRPGRAAFGRREPGARGRSPARGAEHGSGEGESHAAAGGREPRLREGGGRVARPRHVPTGRAVLAAGVRSAARDVRQDVAALVAEVLGVAPDPAWDDSLRLLRDGLALSSQQGARLLTKVLDRWGLDLADDDLALAGLATLGALTGYVARRLAWRI